MQKLPLSLSTFRELRELNYLYVDKTKYAYDLINGDRRYFLSRPRRFGKSLFVSTLYEILSGSKELFNDLWIEASDYEWKSHAVISLDFSQLEIGDITSFQKSLCRALQKIAEYHAFDDIDFKLAPKSIFIDLITALHKKYGRVAILIDEYDNPILQTLHNKKLAKQIQNAIRDFFYIIKVLDKYLHFVFITGVSSFSKSGIFSGLNNLQILTLDDAYGDILGYTDHEIDRYFITEIELWAQKEQCSYEELRKQIKEWYNGYRFGGNVLSVYNPFSLMNALRKKEFKNFWFQSGTPTFLVEELTKEYRKKECELFNVDAIGEVTEVSLGSFEVGTTPLVTLMFQTGYLTIASYNRKNQAYTLKYPNYEVQTTLHKYLLASLIKADITVIDNVSLRLRAAFEEDSFDAVVDSLRRLFSNLPYQLHADKKIQDKEKYYHGILHIICDAAGIKIQSEYPTSHGRIDILIDMPKKLYIIEVKVNESAETALAQIIEHTYYEPFSDYGKPIELVGLAFKKKPKEFEITYATKKLGNF